MGNVTFKELEKSYINRNSIGFLLAKASQKWNDLLYQEFCKAGFEDLRPSYGSILVPLYEEDGLSLGELGRRAGLSKQTMTTMIRNIESKGFVKIVADTSDGRVTRIYLTKKGMSVQEIAIKVIQKLKISF